MGAGMSDLDLLRRARDELRLWLQQMHGMEPRNASVDASRLDPLILALDVRLRRIHSERDCGSTIGGSITFCCEKHADESAADAAAEQKVVRLAPPVAPEGG
jgi:hypothetical protein